MPKRLLFVDDEPMVLQGLRRSLRSMQSEWTMEFVGGGAEALAAMARTPVDVVVTDMRMPGMDGAQLLQEVKSRYPQVIRFVLSGQSSREAVLRSISPAHQYLSKPCDPEELKTRLTRAFALRELLENSMVKALVSQLKSVPSLPALYHQIVDELQAEEPSMPRMGKIISKDAGMTAKILQLANSAFFGLRSHVSNPAQAVCLLGLDMIRAVVLSVHVFSELETDRLADFGVADMWKHTYATGLLAQAIAKSQRADRQAADDSFTAGLLHDIGKLILVSNLPEKYRAVLERVAGEAVPLIEAERESFGCTHAQVGAYLIGIWGLPHTIVEAVAFHHRPSESLNRTFSPLTAVHVADFLAYSEGGAEVMPGVLLDQQHLADLGLADQEPVWRELCQQKLAQMSFQEVKP